MSDIDIKDEPLESCYDYLDHELGSTYSLRSTHETLTSSKQSFELNENKSLKIKDEKNEDLSDHNYGDVEINFVDIGNVFEDQIKNEKFDIKDGSNGLSSSTVDNKIFFTQVQKSEFSNVVSKKLEENVQKNLGNLEEVFIKEEENKVHKLLECSSSHSTSHEISTHSEQGKVNSILICQSPKLFKCSECDYITKRRSYLNTHLLTHLNIKLFKCLECDYGTNNKGDLKVHLLNHSNTNLFKCSHCDYGTNKKSVLKTHLLIHSNTKLFKCSECDYGANQECHYKTHLLTHGIIKLLKCSECDFETNRKQHLKIHKLNHLKTNNLKLFKCSECDYGTNKKSSLKIHVLKHLNSKLFKCTECDYESNYKSCLENHLFNHSKDRTIDQSSL